MARFPVPHFSEVQPEDLLGPLNEVEAKNAPRPLFVAGRSEVLRGVTRVAIVGSRNATDAGLRRAAKLARFLAANDVTVVSGLAKGIDTAAHRAAIEAGGVTVAVLGTPLDQVYPSENAQLQSHLAQEHCLVSQFPLGARVWQSNFIRRNRTMALLSSASVIVEAGETSGSLSQGWEALRLGRPLFILRSVVEDQRLRWPKDMLQYGAVMLAEAEEIADFVPIHGQGGMSVAAF